MKRKHLGILGILVATLLTLSNVASADFTIEFSDDGGNSFADTFSVGQGDSTSFEIYLSESGDSVLTTTGWAGYEFLITLDQTSRGTVSDSSFNSDFSPGGINNSDSEKVELTGGRLTGATFGNPVLLGEFIFNSTAAGTTVFTLSDLNQSGNTWADGNLSLTTHDTEIFGNDQTGTYSFTVNAAAVPEPSSLMLCSALLAGGAIRRRRCAA